MKAEPQGALPFGIGSRGTCNAYLPNPPRALERFIWVVRACVSTRKSITCSITYAVFPMLVVVGSVWAASDSTVSGSFLACDLNGTAVLLQVRFLTRNGFVVVLDNHANLDDTVITDNAFWVRVSFLFCLCTPESAHSPAPLPWWPHPTGRSQCMYQLIPVPQGL